MAYQSKFVSVNLNKSYGRNSSSSSSSAFRDGRSRSGSGGGTVPVSLPRSSSSSVSKPTTRLAVPPPLNLPSLRKEHERFDPASSGASAGHGTSGLGSGSGSSGMGWSKPIVTAPSAEDAVIAVEAQSQLGRSTGSSDRLPGSAYMPPGSRLGTQLLPGAPAQVFTNKSVILRGEDFPSLHATALVLKQKEHSSQKQKQKQIGEEQQERRTELTESRAPIEMRPQMRSSRLITYNASDGNGSSNIPSGASELSQKNDGYFPGPLPQIRFKHTSDWADDERDTGLSLPERARDRGFSMFESGDERSSAPSGELFKGPSFRRDAKPAVSGIRDFGSWRSPLTSRDRLDTHEVGVDKDRYDSRPSSASKEVGQPPLGENGRDGYTHGNQDSPYPRRDIGSHINTQGSKAPAEIFNGRSTEQNARVRYADRSNNWYKGNPFQNNTIAKSHLSFVNKGTSFMTNFNKEKRSVPSAGKSYIDDTGFDSMDPFSGGVCDVNLKVSKKKKDMLNQSYFHDPERESFEAELERILMTQEQERKHIMEEQARVLELARKEKEERERLAREEEERRRLLEKEAREAAWRAEQEKLDAARRADEQRIAREEERKRYQVEEERRKEAARQKLLELEARISRRQAEEMPNDNEFPSADGERVPLSARERDISQISNVRDWEDGERMMENVATLVSSDTLGMNRNLDARRSQSSKHGNLSSMDFGNHSHYSSSLPIQDQVHHNPRRDVSGSRSGTYKKEFHGSLSALRSSSRGGTSESAETLGEYRQPRQQRWNISTDGDHFRKNSYLDDDLHDIEKFVEVGCGHSNSHGSPHTSFDERSLQNFQVDEFSSFTRYRQYLRQPRVPPPPSLTSIQRNSFRGPVERENSSFVNNKAHPRHSSKTDLQSSQLGYDSSYHDILQQISVTSLEENVLHSEQIQEKINPRCDSVSSLSVSSAPSSPAPLLHDEMDTTGDSPALPTSADGERTILSDNECLAPTMQADNLNRMTTSGSVSPGEDDAWGTGNHGVVHGQEYYDEEEDDYQEVDEVHECADSNLDLEQKLEGSHSDGQTANGEMEQVILGFDDGVEVKIPMNIDIEMASRNSDKETLQQAGHPGIENLVSHVNNTLPEVSLDNSLSVMGNTEKAMQDLVLDPITTSYPVSTHEETPSPLILPQHIISAAPSIKQMSTSSTSSNISPSATTSHCVTPVDLQFGLFSGPSLIPSPIPAIQIGSIQMPIHVHTQITPSQPLFQFGLLRYPPPISQNILPLAPQNMSFIPPRVQAPFSFTQNPADFLYKQASQDSSQCKSGDTEPSCMSDNQSGLPPHVGYEQLNASPDRVKNVAAASHSQTERFSIAEQNTIDFVSHQNHGTSATKCHKAIAGNKDYEDQQHAEILNSQSSVANAHTKAPGILSANREKKDSYSEQNYSSLSFPRAEVLRNVSSGFQRRPRRNTHRTEFRVRESAKKRQISGMELLDNVEQDEKSNTYRRTSVVSVGNFGKRDVALNKSFNKTESDDPNLGSSSPRSSNVKTFKATQKDSASKSLTPFDKSSAAKSNLNSEEDVDAPLQSGIVRIFKQPGIETPSDEDDFIEVRSKRQMLNNRREQREKENKSRSKVLKIPRNQRSSPQGNAAISNSNKTAMSSGADASKHARSSSLVTIRRDSSKHDPSLAFIPNASQTLSPIGTPLASADPEARSGDLKSSQRTSYPAESNDMIKLSPTIVLENKVAAAVNPTLSLNSWDNENDTRQVMALTQTQLDEAMKPAQFDSHLDSNVCLEPKAISCIMSQQKSFPSCASPITSLLAGEKIQFGAVTSPTILPLNRAVTNGLSPSGSSRSEVKTHQTLMTANNEHVMFFGKEKHHGASFTNLEDPEAEAEAAASAVAVAAISNDEIVASGVGGSLASATSDNKSFSTADVTGFTSGGGTVSQEASGASVGGESLSVALPADLSVDTSSLSLWPPLPSPQSSGHMLSHFPGAPPSHFPCFDMNSVLGGHVFAYGPNDDSVVSQEQSQRSASLASGPLGAWPQCHSGVDSFYGPPTGFSPFINPGGIPGVQGPSHMVVYNHFAPVGRFGQVGLSFMGTTYIPTGNQPEQKQNQVSSAVGEGKVDCQNGNASMQGTSPGMPAPIQNLGGGSSLMPVSGQGPMPSMPAIQHLGPGSPLMPVAQPLTMFDITPFQSSAGIPMQARWSHVPAPSLHSVPLPIPLKQHHGEGGMSTQFNQSLSIDTSVASNRFRDSHSSLPAGVSRDLPAPSSAASRLPHELALLEQQISTTGSTQSVRSSFTNGNGNNIKVTKSATRTTVTGMSDNGSIGANSSTSSSQNTASKSKQPPSSGHQYLNSGHLAKQGGATQKNVSGGEWHRGTGFHGRNQISGSDKNIGSSKMKQIYVAKPSTSVSSSQAR